MFMQDCQSSRGLLDCDELLCSLWFQSILAACLWRGGVSEGMVRFYLEHILRLGVWRRRHAGQPPLY